ncbi:hypothetical protein SEVIR_2G248650v4 [Setaria viridis]
MEAVALYAASPPRHAVPAMLGRLGATSSSAIHMHLNQARIVGATRAARTRRWFSVPAAFQWNRPAAQVRSPYSASSQTRTPCSTSRRPVSFVFFPVSRGPPKTRTTQNLGTLCVRVQGVVC